MGGMDQRGYLMSAGNWSRRTSAAVFCAVSVALCSAPAAAQTLSYMPVDREGAMASEALPDSDALGVALRRQVVTYRTTEAPGTVIIDTAHTFLYLTLGDGKALRYGIGVGREGFGWSGVETISRKSEWPDWIPPAEMIARQPYLPRWVGGGPGNPLGARALYLGNTPYRIHGTNNPSSIGKRVSSGCIRLRDADVVDLYDRVGIGTKVVVLPDSAAQVERAFAHDEERRIFIAAGRGGPMTARIIVKPVSADQPQPRRQAGGGPSPVGLY
jgi:lipoprotein-anchoring transpeptidase ErfK/SrfK